jgi:hypothetical protein
MQIAIPSYRSQGIPTALLRAGDAGDNDDSSHGTGRHPSGSRNEKMMVRQALAAVLKKPQREELVRSPLAVVAVN